MSSRRKSGSDSKPENRLEKAGALVRQRALTGTEASTIGFLLVGYIGAFSFLGYWLDSYFKTSWIVAVGVLVGAVIGFREMFRLAQKLGRESIQNDAEKSREQLTRGVQIENKSAPHETDRSNEPLQNTELHKPRYFSVPAPPTASFDKSNFEKLDKDEKESTDLTAGLEKPEDSQP